MSCMLQKCATFQGMELIYLFCKVIVNAERCVAMVMVAKRHVTTDRI